MRFVAPQDLGPLHSGPPPVSLSPVEPPELLCLGEERLLGGDTAGDLELPADDVTEIVLKRLILFAK